MRNVVVSNKAAMVMKNSSLDTLGLEKWNAERFMVTGVPMNVADPELYGEVVKGVYKMIFGNAYIMESERDAMDKAESQFKLGEINVKEFCMALALTEEYKKRFFDNRPLYGAIEMNFKHFLGRTPDGLEQYREKSGIYDSMGYVKFVESFFNSGEYDAVFGDWTVPYIRGYATEANISMAAFTHLFQVVRGASTSDKASINKKIPLNSKGIRSIPIPVKAPGGPIFIEGFVTPGSQGNSINSAATTKHGIQQDGKMFRIEITNLKQTAARGRAGVSAVGSVYSKSNRFSTYARSNKAIICSAADLSKKYKEITKNGGRICSVTPL